MDNLLLVLLAPSMVAGFVGWFVGEQHGFERAVDVVDAMPGAAFDLDAETDGADGFLERARR